MPDYSKRRRGFLIRFLLKVGGAVLLTLLAFFAARGAYNMYGKFQLAAVAGEQAEERLAELQEQKKEIGTAVKEFNSSRGLEAEIRERYGVARPGEGRIEIVRQSGTTTKMQDASENGFIRFFQNLWPF